MTYSDWKKLTKRQIAELIEQHHLYSPHYCNSKNYYYYNSDAEQAYLVKMFKKDELLDWVLQGYTVDGRELSASEM